MSKSAGTTPPAPRRLRRWALAASLGVLAVPPLAGAPGAAAITPTAPRSSASASLEGCITAAVQSERTATFAGEMTALPGSTRMEMRVDLLERTRGELHARMVTAPGLGLWRAAAPDVKVYKYVKQVTDLSAPASYSALVRFRWLGSHGRLMRVAQRHTATCEQPLDKASPASGANL